MWESRSAWLIAALTIGLAVWSAVGRPLVLRAKLHPDSAWCEYKTRTLEQLAGSDELSVDTGLSTYGGLLTRRSDSTGFFHARKVDGRWWLVDPRGCLYINKAVVSVGPGSGPTPGAALPDRFGTRETWADSATRMLRRNGFNGTGAWSSDKLLGTA